MNKTHIITKYGGFSIGSSWLTKTFIDVCYSKNYYMLLKKNRNFRVYTTCVFKKGNRHITGINKLTNKPIERCSVLPTNPNDHVDDNMSESKMSEFIADEMLRIPCFFKKH